MITVYVLFTLKNGNTEEQERKFKDKISALRFMYNMRRKKQHILGWKCENAEDNDYLSKRFYLSSCWLKGR